MTKIDNLYLEEKDIQGFFAEEFFKKYLVDEKEQNRINGIDVVDNKILFPKSSKNRVIKIINGYLTIDLELFKENQSFYLEIILRYIANAKERVSIPLFLGPGMDQVIAAVNANQNIHEIEHFDNYLSYEDYEQYKKLTNIKRIFCYMCDKRLKDYENVDVHIFCTNYENIKELYQDLKSNQVISINFVDDDHEELYKVEEDSTYENPTFYQEIYINKHYYHNHREETIPYFCQIFDNFEIESCPKEIARDAKRYRKKETDKEIAEELVITFGDNDDPLSEYNKNYSDDYFNYAKRVYIYHNDSISITKFLPLFKHLDSLGIEIHMQYCHHSFYTYEELKKLKNIPSFKGFLSINDLITIDNVIETKKLISMFVSEINSKNLSPFEKYIYAYSISKSYKPYNILKEDLLEGYESENGSRKTIFTLFNNQMCCAGYVNLLNDILKELNDPNIKTISYICKVKGEYHQRGLIGIRDKKYNVRQVFVSDPTEDNTDFTNSYGRYENLALAKKEPHYPDSEEDDYSDIIFFYKLQRLDKDNLDLMSHKIAGKKFFFGFNTHKTTDIPIFTIERAIKNTLSTINTESVNLKAYSKRTQLYLQKLIMELGYYYDGNILEQDYSHQKIINRELVIRLFQNLLLNQQLANHIYSTDCLIENNLYTWLKKQLGILYRETSSQLLKEHISQCLISKPNDEKFNDILKLNPIEKEDLEIPDNIKSLGQITNSLIATFMSTCGYYFNQNKYTHKTIYEDDSYETKYFQARLFIRLVNNEEFKKIILETGEDSHSLLGFLKIKLNYLCAHKTEPFLNELLRKKEKQKLKK